MLPAAFAGSPGTSRSRRCIRQLGRSIRAGASSSTIRPCADAVASRPETRPRIARFLRPAQILGFALRPTQDLSDGARTMHVACVTGKDRADPGPTSRPGAAHLRGAQGSDGFAASGGRAQCVSCATRKVGAPWPRCRIAIRGWVDAGKRPPNQARRRMEARAREQERSRARSLSTGSRTADRRSRSSSRASRSG